MDLVGTRLGHLRIDALVGRGGMGEVYRAWDEVLERRVAVKAIAPSQRWNAESRARFRREAQLLARFQHPGICQVHDYVEAEDADYLVLELVEGETLSQASADGLPPGRALELAEQIATVLAAAHAQGIVHRDLKPANVMILPGGAVKLLDFGLARAMDAALERDEGPPVGLEPVVDLPGSGITRGPLLVDTYQTAAGSVVGTLHYMSPEQARGQTVTAAGDVYAFGILLQELVTGRPAYGATEGLGHLLARVVDARTEPPLGVDPELARLIERLTAREPGDRPTAAEAAATLRELIDRPTARARRRRRAAGIAGLILLLVVTVGLTWRLARPAAWVASGERARVAIVPFSNATGDGRLAWVEQGLPEMVGRTLQAAADVVPADDAAKSLANLSAARAPALDAAAAAELLDALGATVLVDARIERTGPSFALVYRVHGRRGLLAERRLAGLEPTELTSELARRLAHRLAPERPPQALSDVFSDDHFANHAYAIAESTIRGEGARRAQAYYQICLDRDPEFARARLGLTRCLISLARLDEAAAEAGRVLEAARVRSDLDLEAEALARLGEVAQSRGDFPAARAHLDGALTLARRSGNRVMEAACLNQSGRVALRQSRYAEADDAFTRSLEIVRQAGDRRGEQVAINNLGMVRWQRGELEPARRSFVEALEIARALRDRALQLAALNNVAGLDLQSGRTAEAVAGFEQVAELAQAVGDASSEVAARTNLGLAAFYLGDYPTAERALLAALATRRAQGNRPSESLVLANLASILAEQGRLDEALGYGEAALAIRREVGDRRGQGRVLTTLGLIRLEQSRVPEGARLLAEARDILAAAGDRLHQAEAVAGLGMAAAARGRLGEARRLLAEAEGLGPGEPPVIRLAARIAYEQGDFAGAVGALGRLREGLGGRWGESEEQVMAACLEARDTGRRVPVPW